MRSIRRCSGRALAVTAVLAVTLGAPIAAISDSAYASGTPTAVAHDDSSPTDPGTGPASTDPATTDPATTDPATTDPATTDPATTDPAPVDPTSDPTTDPGSPTSTVTAQVSSGDSSTKDSPPSYPTGVSATQTADQTVLVSWFPPDISTTDSVDSYAVNAHPSDGSPDLPCPHPLSSTDLSCTFFNLTDGVTYTFTVTASNDAGPGPGAQASFTPQAPPPAVVPPGAPANVSASASTLIGLGNALVSWSPVDGGGATVTYTVSGSGTCSTGATSCVVHNLTPGTTASFTVTASNSAGPTVGGSASVQLGSVPGKPTFTTSAAGNGQIRLNWNAPADGGATITKYTVGGNVVGGPGGTAGCGVFGTPAGTTCLVTGLVDGDSYVFDIYATNAYGNGPVSNFSKPILIPAAPDASPTTQPVVTDPGNGPPSSSTPPSGNGGASTGAMLLVHHTKLALGKPTTKKGATTLAASLTADGITGGVASQRITVLVQDRLRHKSLHTIITNGAGKASFTFTAQVTTDVELIYPGSGGYTPVTKATTLVVGAPQGCKVKVTTGFGTATASGTCSEAHLPRGTRLQLQYLSGKKWIAAASGKSTSTMLHFSLTLNRAGSYKVRVLLAANSVYGATTLTLPTLRVR